MTTVTLPEEYADVDPTDETLYTSGRSHGYYRWLREHDPLHWDDRLGHWIVTRYDDVAEIERNPARYISGQGIVPKGGEALNLSIVSMDDPEHARQRKLVSKAFTPSRINALVDHIREIARSLVDEMAPLGSCDFVERLAYPLPLVVIAELMGLPVEDRARLGEWSDRMMAASIRDADDPRLVTAGEAWGEYITYLLPLIEQRRAEPADDIISVLVQAGSEGGLDHDHARLESEARAGNVTGNDELLADELLQFLVLLVVAGNETTRNALSGGMVLLSEHPDQRDALADDPDLVPLAAEEIIRLVTPVRYFTRTVTEDHELRGKELHAGDKVMLVYGSANRDPEQFPDPDRFDIRRMPNQQLSFGAGPHFCLGANLARTEIRIALEELLARLPDIHVPPGAEPVRGESRLVEAIEELPVVYTPA